MSRAARPRRPGDPNLIAIDIGNTNIVIGLFRGRTLLSHWRLSTQSGRTADEYGLTVRALLRDAECSRPSESILSSVVPNLTPVFVDVLSRHFGMTPHVVSHRSPLGLTIAYRTPEEIGADRLVNAAAAYEAFGGPLIIVDFGTATTFCVVTADGAYRGGVIAPGIGISADALTSRAAKLSKVEWVLPSTTIGRDTASSMQTGIIQGHACMVDGIVRLVQKELGMPCRVVATGGLTTLVQPASESIATVNPHLTLEGLALIAERVRRSSGQVHLGQRGRSRSR
jgi:type III pantothenate kinase